MPKKSTSVNAEVKPSQNMGDCICYDFKIQGAQIRAIFAKDTDSSTMDMVKSMLINSYVANTTQIVSEVKATTDKTA